VVAHLALRGNRRSENHHATPPLLISISLA